MEDANIVWLCQRMDSPIIYNTWSLNYLNFIFGELLKSIHLKSLSNNLKYQPMKNLSIGALIAVIAILIFAFKKADQPGNAITEKRSGRSEERRVGKECRSR